MKKWIDEAREVTYGTRVAYDTDSFVTTKFIKQIGKIGYESNFSIRRMFYTGTQYSESANL